jgi:hypothetical protein
MRRQLDDVLRLVAEQADGLDVLDQRLLAQGQHLLGVSAIGEQRARGLVHADVGRLRRQGDGDQQGEGVDMLQLALRFGVRPPWKRVKISRIAW